MGSGWSIRMIEEDIVQRILREHKEDMERKKLIIKPKKIRKKKIETVIHDLTPLVYDNDTNNKMIFPRTY